jgi:hypothetical protein
MCREPQFKGRITGIINSSVCQGHRRPEQFEKMEFFNFLKFFWREKGCWVLKDSFIRAVFGRIAAVDFALESSC